MRTREALLTPLDLELLRALSETPNLIEACRRLSLSRDRGIYRLRRLGRLLHARVVVTRKGGSTGGETRLTRFGTQLLLRDVGPLDLIASRSKGRPAQATFLRGTWHRTPSPHVVLPDSLVLQVGFGAREGEAVRMAIGPESALVALRRFPSSARNVLHGEVESIRHLDGVRVQMRVRVGAATAISVVLTRASATKLRLRRGSRVYLYIKATAIRKYGASVRR